MRVWGRNRFWRRRRQVDEDSRAARSHLSLRRYRLFGHDESFRERQKDSFRESEMATAASFRETPPASTWSCAEQGFCLARRRSQRASSRYKRLSSHPGCASCLARADRSRQASVHPRNECPHMFNQCFFLF
jgi:hypothetical protein